MADYTAGIEFIPEIIFGGIQGTYTAGIEFIPEVTYGGVLGLTADTTPPTVSFSELTGVLAPSTMIQVRSVDTGGTLSQPSGIASVSVYVDHAAGLELVAVLRAPGGTLGSVEWNDPYLPGAVRAYGVNGFELDVERVGGWAWSSFDLRAVVTDRAGNITTLTTTYGISPAPTAPSITFVPNGASIPYDTATPIRIDVLDTVDGGNITHVQIIVVGATRAELAFDAVPPSTAEPGYTVMQTNLSPGRRFEVLRVGGWLEDFDLFVTATDDRGLVTTDSASFTLSSTPSPGDSVPPVTSNISPAPGTPITSSTPVLVDVTDESGLFRRVIIAVVLGGITEMAWDGDAWLGRYAGGNSTRTPITNGFRFTVLRDLRSGGWPSSPTLRVFAFDQGGNEV